MMRLSRLLLCASSLAILTLFAGCVEKVSEPIGPPPGGEIINKPTAGTTTTGSGIELELYTWTETDELEVNRELIKQFEADHPGIKVNLVNISGSREAMQKLETKMAAKDGPDVMSLHGAYYGVRGRRGPADLENSPGMTRTSA